MRRRERSDIEKKKTLKVIEHMHGVFFRHTVPATIVCMHEIDRRCGVSNENSMGIIEQISETDYTRNNKHGNQVQNKHSGQRFIV